MKTNLDEACALYYLFYCPCQETWANSDGMLWFSNPPYYLSHVIKGFVFEFGFWAIISTLATCTSYIQILLKAILKTPCLNLDLGTCHDLWLLWSMVWINLTTNIELMVTHMIIYAFTVDFNSRTPQSPFHGLFNPYAQIGSPPVESSLFSCLWMDRVT